jgi:hypothetical protein
MDIEKITTFELLRTNDWSFWDDCRNNRDPVSEGRMKRLYQWFGKRASFFHFDGPGQGTTRTVRTEVTVQREGLTLLVGSAAAGFDICPLCGQKLAPARKLIERWPAWFNANGDVGHTLMPFGFLHGDGWFDIVWRLCQDLEPLLAKLEETSGYQFEVLQVKEKLGRLRIHVNSPMPPNRPVGVRGNRRKLRTSGKTT